MSVEDTIGVHVLWLEAKIRGTLGSLLIAIHYKRSLLQPVVWRLNFLRNLPKFPQKGALLVHC